MSLFPALLQAQDAGSAIQSVRVGIENRLKVGTWAEIQVETNGVNVAEAAVVVIAPDSDGNLVEMPLTAWQDDAAVYSGIMQIGRLEGAIRVEMRTNGSVTESATLTPSASEPYQTAIFRRNTEFWGVLGTSAPFDQAAEAMTAATRRVNGRSSPEAAVVTSLDWARMPRHIDGWDSLDVVVLSGDALNVTSEQDRLLQQWTTRGGRLVLTLGGATDAFLESPLARWCPITVQGTRIATQLDAVSALIPGSALLTVSRLHPDVQAAKFQTSPDRPAGNAVLLRAAYGTGAVTAFAFDLDSQPLSHWEDLPKLCQTLVDWGRRSTNRVSESAELASTGVSDLSTQLIAGLDQFPEIGRPSFRTVLLWTFLWVLFLGPIDYLIVHRILRKPHATWVTLPIWVALAAVIGTRAATASNSHQMTSNQIDLVDVDAKQGTVRGRSWMTFYSPQTARYRINAQSAITGDRAEVCWLGKPEEGLRGLYRRQGGAAFGTATYQMNADRTEIDGLPVRIWSSFSLAADWTGADATKPLITAKLRDTGAGRLGGSLQHHFEGALTDWIIVYRNFVFYPIANRGELTIADLPPNVDWNPERGAQYALRAFLTGTQESAIGTDVLKSTVAVKVDDYDPLEDDPTHLMRTLVFHEAAGGAEFTGLTNHPLAKVDSSRVISSDSSVLQNTAILLARLRSTGTTFQIDGEKPPASEHWTFVRAVLPVEQSAAAIYRGEK